MRNQADTAAVEKRNNEITHLPHVREVEQNPPEGEKEYRIQVGKECGGLFKIFPEEQFFDNDDNPEIHSPKHEIPACTVPKSGEHPNDCGVKQGARKSAAVAAEGNVDVFPEPCGKGDMPSAPEFADTAGDIGVIKVFEELKPEHSAETYCHI